MMNTYLQVRDIEIIDKSLKLTNKEGDRLADKETRSKS
jgi:hypothetical protein